MFMIFRKKASFSLIALAVFLMAAVGAAAAERPAAKAWPAEWDGCTSIEVGRLATVDGSVITCHTCDGPYRTWLNIVPHQTWPDKSMNKIYAGKMHTEFPDDLRGVIQTGEIPQVPETYRFLNTAYPCLNEHGLAIGETTIGGRRELVNPEGMFMIEEVERLILERCRTAREAIRLAGDLVEQYGYGDYGECITIADGKEVWHFEIFGAGPLEKGAVWAAVRIPDDHVGISANIPRISEINLKDPDRYMASDNVFKVAEDMGWWDPKGGEPFKFWKAYGGRRPYSTREFFVLSTLAPGLKLTMDMPELPFSVKPEKKLSARDVLRIYRDPYSGTDLDMTKNLPVFPERQRRRRGEPAPAEPAQPKMVPSPIVSAWMPRDVMQLVNALKPGTIQMQRTIPIAGCSYATVLQVRGWLPPAVGAVCWFSFDNPAMSARVPIFAGTTELPPSFEVCGQHRFRMDSADWAFRRTNRLATLKWGTGIEANGTVTVGAEIQNTIAEFEDRAFVELPLVEKRVQEILAGKTSGQEPFTAVQYLTKYTNDFARAAIQKYLDLGDKYWMLLAMGL